MKFILLFIISLYLVLIANAKNKVIDQDSDEIQEDFKNQCLTLDGGFLEFIRPDLKNESCKTPPSRCWGNNGMYTCDRFLFGSDQCSYGLPQNSLVACANSAKLDPKAEPASLLTLWDGEREPGYNRKRLDILNRYCKNPKKGEEERCSVVRNRAKEIFDYEMNNPAPASCSPIRLNMRDSGTGRNQNNFGNCYAEAASILLEDQYRKIKNKWMFHDIDAFDIALQTKKPIGFMKKMIGGRWHWVDGGFVCNAANSVKDIGVCEWNPEADLYYKELVNIREAVDEKPACSWSEPINKLRETLQVSNFEELVRKKYSSICRNRTQIPPFQCHTINSRNEEVVKENTHKLLESGTPVAISYCAQILNRSEIKSDADIPRLVNDSTIRTANCGAHASVIVGRRWNYKTRTCEYRIRNSWGNSCPEVTDPYLGGCLKGEFWLSEKIMNKNIFNLNYLK